MTTSSHGTVPAQTKIEHWRSHDARGHFSNSAVPCPHKEANVDRKTRALMAGTTKRCNTHRIPRVCHWLAFLMISRESSITGTIQNERVNYCIKRESLAFCLLHSLCWLVVHVWTAWWADRCGAMEQATWSSRAPKFPWNIYLLIETACCTHPLRMMFLYISLDSNDIAEEIATRSELAPASTSVTEWRRIWERSPY